MASRTPAIAPADGGQPVRDQLARILASATFQQGDRLKRFLSFIVLEAIAGRQNELKEYVIGVQVFGKTSSACRCSGRKTASIRAPTRSFVCKRGDCAQNSLPTTAR